MNDIGNDIIEIFSSSSELISKKETCDDFIIEYQINTIDKVLPPINVLKNISSRDEIAIHFFETEDSDSIDYLSTNRNSWSEFIHELKSKNIQQSKIKIHIEKKSQEGLVSIYDIDSFTKYINSLSLSQFIAVINSFFSNSWGFEIQDEYYHQWKTNTIAFLRKNSTMNFHDIGNIDRKNRISDARKLCYSEIKKYNLIPEDFYCSEIDITNPLQKTFLKACMIYMCSFIFDYSIFKNDVYEYKINGFKTLSEQIDIKTISNIKVDINSCRAIYDIYRWIYLGGNSTDKINIARYIISLNINCMTLQLNPLAFESILSNYKIYEKQNVTQYLEMRNQLSELLINLQEKIMNIMDTFIGDFKKNILTLVSFFISVIVIEVVSNGDFTHGFTNEIIGLSSLFLLISFGLLIYSRWELTQKLNLYNKHYNQIKERYKDVLSDIELENIFEECDPQKNDTNAHFVKKQKKYYSILWFLSIIGLGVFLYIIYLDNNSNSNNVSNPDIGGALICCIRNIFQ